MKTLIIEKPTASEDRYNIRRIVVAYDASSSAKRALKDAMAIGQRFGSEIVLAQAMGPAREAVSSIAELRVERLEEAADLEIVRATLVAKGLRSRALTRGGIAGDALFEICCEESADLLLLGAYGFGAQDRQTLGSTAEYLLRAVPCPTLTYGPKANEAFDSNSEKGPVLVPISLPFNQNLLQRAAEIVNRFGLRLEVMHVLERTQRTVVRELECQCEELTRHLRSNGVLKQWSLFGGAPAAVIHARAKEIRSPFILMPLRWGNGLSSLTSDNVAASVIRSSATPVMTYRTEEPRRT